LHHQSHEGTQSIGQSKRHDRLIQSVLSFEGSLPFISGMVANLVITTFQIDLGENSGT